MGQAMNHAVGLIKFRRDCIEVLSIAPVVPAKYSIGYVVRDLHNARGTRIDE